MKKERLDKVLTDLGYFETKSKAAAAILAGDVLVNGEKITKSGYQIDLNKKYEYEIHSMPFVSRGGLKLQRALDVFDIDVKDRICFDAGASTGGFTDCLLSYGAKFVYAVDVGYGQIAWKLRVDERVKNIEKTNLKICEFNDIYSDTDRIANLLVSDLSFISLKKVLPNLVKLLDENFNEMICLIKPQFEAGKELIEKGGVVRNPKTHIEILEDIVTFIRDMNYSIKGLTHSPIKGPAGNIEYLVHCSSEKFEFGFNINDIVNNAFSSLNE